MWLASHTAGRRRKLEVRDRGESWRRVAGWTKNSCATLSRPPAHLVNQCAGAPVHGLAANDEALLFIEPDGADVVFVDVQIEALGRYPFGFGEEGGCESRSPGFGGHHHLIEIEALWIDGDKADDPTIGFCNCDGCNRNEILVPALPPPFEAGGEIDRRVGDLPGPAPKLDRRILVCGQVATQRKGRAGRDLRRYRHRAG